VFGETGEGDPDKLNPDALRVEFVALIWPLAIFSPNDEPEQTR